MFREMRYVYEVYRQRSFSKAAQALFIAQPSLSQMVRKAEERTGGPLFDRSTMPITLTALGRAYIEAAEEIMQVEARFGRYMSDVENCLTGILTLGGTTLFASYVLPPLISAFSAKYPGVEIRLHEQHTRVLKQELQDGELDLCADYNLLDSNQYESFVYQQERLILAVPKTYPINDLYLSYQMTAADIRMGNIQFVAPLPLEKMEEVPFLLLKEGNDTRMRANSLCNQAGFAPKIRLQLDQQLAAYNLAAYGMGAAFVSDTLVKNAVPDDRLVFYHCNPEIACRNIYFFHKRNRIMSAPGIAFINLLNSETTSS